MAYRKIISYWIIGSSNGGMRPNVESKHVALHLNQSTAAINGIHDQRDMPGIAAVQWYSDGLLQRRGG